MASTEYRSRSTRVIAYFNKQKLIFPLGPVPKKTAERFVNNIDALLHERRCNLPLSREVSAWLADLDDSLYELLVTERLADPRVTAPTLDRFIAAYIEGRTDVTERRVGKLKNAQARILEFFGDVQIETVTPGAADEYGRWLLKTLSPATAHKECQIAAQFFRHAYRKELISRNPFDGVSVGKATNNDRRAFVSRDDFAEVLDKCPNWQWRTVAALARYGGLRCPSEVAPLTWSDIHWDQERFTVTSPKTKRYGKATRIVPLFPELRAFLDEAYAQVPDRSTWVVPMLNGQADKNLGTTFRKIVGRAGVKAWPKPFQNLRSSRQTELEQHYATYKVCAWLGNTPAVAHKHYLTVTEDDYTTAAQAKTGDWLGIQSLAKARTEPHGEIRRAVELRENATFSEVVGILESARVAEEGFEPPTRGL